MATPGKPEVGGKDARGFGSPRVRHLIVVRRDQGALFSYLGAHAARDGHIIVILDRRLGERRQRVEPVPAERRLRGRRAPPGPQQARDLEELGFASFEARPQPAGDGLTGGTARA